MIIEIEEMFNGNRNGNELGLGSEREWVGARNQKGNGLDPENGN